MDFFLVPVRHAIPLPVFRKAELDGYNHENVVPDLLNKLRKLRLCIDTGTEHQGIQEEANQCFSFNLVAV